LSESPPNCPKCGEPLTHVRMWNPEICGEDDKKNPWDGWVCKNPDCKGWWCECCEKWHPYGTRCSVAAVRNIRSGTNYPEIDPSWKHYEGYDKEEKSSERINKKYEDIKINELLEQLLESRRQIDAIQEQLRTIRINILYTMNYLAGRLFELKEASENEN